MANGRKFRCSMCGATNGESGHENIFLSFNFFFVFFCSLQGGTFAIYVDGDLFKAEIMLPPAPYLEKACFFGPGVV
jgi:hypothetical protein